MEKVLRKCLLRDIFLLGWGGEREAESSGASRRQRKTGESGADLPHSCLGAFVPGQIGS